MEQGNSDGQYRLGRCYEFAIGVEKNFDNAFKLYKKCAEKTVCDLEEGETFRD